LCLSILRELFLYLFDFGLKRLKRTLGFERPVIYRPQHEPYKQGEQDYRDTEILERDRIVEKYKKVKERGRKNKMKNVCNHDWRP
jgi:hypothetical protein